MISPAAPTRPHPTLWGLTPTQLHDRFWAARGVQVVRQGEPSEIVADAELFLLTDPRTLVIFDLGKCVEQLSWVKPDVLSVRLNDSRDRGYRERVVSGSDRQFVRFERIYSDFDTRQARVALTPDPRLAHLWQRSVGTRQGWRALREEVPRSHRGVMSVTGSVYDRRSEEHTSELQSQSNLVCRLLLEKKKKQ